MIVKEFYLWETPIGAITIFKELLNSGHED